MDELPQWVKTALSPQLIEDETVVFQCVSSAIGSGGGTIVVTDKKLLLFRKAATSWRGATTVIPYHSIASVTVTDNAVGNVFVVRTKGPSFWTGNFLIKLRRADRENFKQAVAKISEYAARTEM